MTTLSKDVSSVVLAPSPRLPLLIFLLGLALLPLPYHPWPTLLNSLVSLVLLLQAYSIRLEFNNNALIVWYGERELRRFPYEDWISWRLFWGNFGCLLYFREQKSPHLIPVLFDAVELRTQLRQRVGSLEQPAPSSTATSS